MSLQVWLPLTKDLRQQGLSNAVVTNSGSIYQATGGKLGGCYSFGTGASALSLPKSFFTSFSGDFSIACWVKIITWNSSYATIWAATSTSSSWSNIMAGLFRNGSSSKILFCIGNDSSSTQSNCITTEDIQLNTWYHFVCTYTSGKICLYQNGNLVSSYNTSIIPKFSATQYFNIGKMRENTYQTNSSINDFRIYDHCLSPMEVKQISQGLVLHYPLNREGWGQENLIADTDFNGSSKKYTVTSGTEGGFTYTPVETILANTEYTISCQLRGNANINLYKLCTGGNEAITWVNRSQLSTTEYRPFSITFTYPSNKTLNQIYICTRYGTSNTSTGDWFEIKPNSLKLEKGSKATPWCPNSSDVLATTIGLNSTTEYDVSGFSNNGIRVGVFSWTSDTPKYNVSTNLSGTNNWIQASSLIFSIKEAITVNIWAYKDDWSSSINLGTPFSCIQGGGVGWSADSSSAYMNVYCGTGTSSNSYAILTTTKSKLTSGWHMLTLTYDGLVCKSYIDGVLDQSLTKYTTKTPIYYNTGTGIFIGGEADSNTTTPKNLFKGKVSDLRIYATALSADDVKALYENSAYIANNGTIYTYEFIEE